MLYKYVIRGCECWLSQETIDALEEERRAIEDERRAWENLDIAYRRACESDDPIDWAIYSDIFKDCYGVRPRH